MLPTPPHSDGAQLAALDPTKRSASGVKAAISLAHSSNPSEGQVQADRQRQILALLKSRAWPIDSLPHLSAHGLNLSAVDADSAAWANAYGPERCANNDPALTTTERRFDHGYHHTTGGIRLRNAGH
jgi:hypothetical protein